MCSERMRNQLAEEQRAKRAVLDAIAERVMTTSQAVRLLGYAQPVWIDMAREPYILGVRTARSEGWLKIERAAYSDVASMDVETAMRWVMINA